MLDHPQCERQIAGGAARRVNRLVKSMGWAGTVAFRLTCTTYRSTGCAAATASSLWSITSRPTAAKATPSKFSTLLPKPSL